MIEVTTARQAAERDAEAIAAGVPSRALMQRAGVEAAAAVVRRYGSRLERGIAVFAGPGNNGGDAWVVARTLAEAGYTVRAREPAPSATEDARAERTAAVALVNARVAGDELVVVDGLLGSGASGEPRGAIAEAIEEIAAMRARGARVVSLDLPSGVGATTGAAGRSVTADLTVAFGTLKRGCLVARGRCGRIEIVDIGLPPRNAAVEPPVPLLVDRRFVADTVPPLAAESHKGQRRRLAIVGGAVGMVGAAMLAARAAMRSGIGMVRLFVERQSVPAVQGATPEALAREWPENDEAVRDGIVDWAHGLLIGPGLGTTKESRAVAMRVMEQFKGPIVVDADALNLFEGAASDLAAHLRDRPALVTPHVNEFARLTGRSPEDVLADRFEAPIDLAHRLGAVVLLKGVPTIIADPAGRRLVSARGTPALAAAGSGDLLAGIAATLVTQRSEAFESAACAAFVHGRAGEVASGGRAVRGVAISDVQDSLQRAWPRREKLRLPRGVLALLPAVGG